jgi:nitrate reductase molybdenum cofactor assembly chaperone NarJ/NarW
MYTNKQLLCKITSLLLEYPRGDFWDYLDDLEAGLEPLSSTEDSRILRDFIKYLQSATVTEIQQGYTDTFDMSSATSLNVTHHDLGKSKERGAALVQLQQIYRENGYELKSTELPDYLPLILEFWSVCPERVFLPMAARFRVSIEMLASRLEEMKSPYAGLLKLTLHMVST